MTTPLTPFVVYFMGPSPNPWKVVFLLEELGLPYELSPVSNDELKKEPYISINPNGRVPGFVDPNKDITLWESGAIIDYLLAEYDTNHTLQYTSFPEKYTTRCWEHFQMSGQGPYFGQLAWFLYFHPEQVSSAIDRYAKEINRVTGVIDTHLGKTGSQYLVGDKFTYADLMWLPYFHFVPHMFSELVDLSQWKYYSAWISRIQKRPAVAKILPKWQELINATAAGRKAAQGAQKNGHKETAE